MSLFGNKRVLLLGFLAILLVAIPLTLFLVRKQQEVRSRANPSTTLSLVQTPQTANVGQAVKFDVMVNPGQNTVSFVKFTITYDPTKVSVAPSGLAVNTDPTNTLSSVLEGPTYGTGSATLTLGANADPTKVLQSLTKIATITFTAIASTNGIPTQISFDQTAGAINQPKTQVLSTAGTDQTNENVLSSAIPAQLTIGGGGVVTPTPTLPPVTPPPGGVCGAGQRACTNFPNLCCANGSDCNANATACLPIGTPTPPPNTTGAVPVCTALTVDKATSGTAPYSLTFTATGTTPNASISKVTFNFGDGPLADVTQGGNIGTNAVTVQSPHTYNSAGSFTATALLTDNTGAVSTPSASCTQNIVIAAGAVKPAPTSLPITQATPIPTTQPIPNTGPGDTFIKVGAIGGILSVLGGLLFFAL
ncbi:MAG TPA: cohesin domain-containing protein [Candidatus Saccharimonadales bacterium]|nr:cohesin domain-containing protein [Candidatus Saccharimonadales bacterium]